jgi:hypothetical protein
MPRPELYDPEAEKALLGAVLADPTGNGPLLIGKPETLFRDNRNQAICKAIQSHLADGTTFDNVIVSNDLSGEFEGISPYITGLINSIGLTTNAGDYIEILEGLQQDRKLNGLAGELATAVSKGQDKTDILQRIHSTIEPMITSTPRFTIHTAEEALQPIPPIEYILKDLISKDSVSLFFGEPGSKKTYSLISLAVCVAAGKPWLGFECKQGRVLIVDEESGEKRLSIRLGDALRGELIEGTAPLQFISLANFKLDEPGDVALLTKVIKDNQIDLVIIDALADVMTGDENSKQDTQPIFAALRKIADQTNAAVIIIHHSNKTGGYRGSSAIKGAVDLMVLVESDNESEFVNFKVEKNRDGQFHKWSAKATWTDGQFYLSTAEQREKPRVLVESQEYVLRHLKKYGHCSLPDIEANADTCSANAARLAVYSLASMGKVYRTNPGAKGMAVRAIYAIQEDQPP